MVSSERSESLRRAAMHTLMDVVASRVRTLRRVIVIAVGGSRRPTGRSTNYLDLPVHVYLLRGAFGPNVRVRRRIARLARLALRHSSAHPGGPR
jgi:hypothetical protein